MSTSAGASTGLVGVAEHYAQFVKLCRLRIEQLGITYDTVDALCGFPARYTAILLSGGKAMSVYSFFTMARALALLPAFQHDEEQFAELSGREDWIEMRRKGPRWRPKLAGSKHSAVVVKLWPDLLRKRAVQGGHARADSLTPYQRKMIAKRAAQIRWQNAKP